MHFINEYSFDFVLQCGNRGPMTSTQSFGVVNTRLHLPSEANLFSFSELSEPTIPCYQRSLMARQNETRGDSTLPASDELFDEAADQISGRNLPVFKTGFV